MLCRPAAGRRGEREVTPPIELSLSKLAVGKLFSFSPLLECSNSIESSRIEVESRKEIESVANRYHFISRIFSPQDKKQRLDRGYCELLTSVNVVSTFTCTTDCTYFENIFKLELYRLITTRMICVTSFVVSKSMLPIKVATCEYKYYISCSETPQILARQIFEIKCCSVSTSNIETE